MYLLKLEDDARLKITLSKEVGEISTVNLCRLFAEKCHTGFRVDDLEQRSMRFTFGVKEESVANCMDAAASIGCYRWENIGKKGYRFLTSTKEISILGNGSDPRRAEAEEKLLDLIDNISKLPADVKKDFADGKKVSGNRLNASMFNTVKNYYVELTRAVARVDSSDLLYDKMVSGNPNQYAISIEDTYKTPGLKRYSITAVGPIGGGTFELSDYERRYGIYRKRGGANDNQQIWTPEDEPEKVAAAQKHPSLNKRVTIDLPKATLVDCLRVLNQSYGYSVISLSNFFWQRRKPVSLRAVPLRYALDTLVKTYYEGKELAWERRPSGFLVIRRADFGFATQTRRIG